MNKSNDVKKIRVLLIEDNKIVRRTLERALEATPEISTVVAHHSHQEAILARQHSPSNFDAFFMQAGSGGQRGAHAAKLIRTIELENKLNPIPLCGLLYERDSEAQKSCLRAGMNASLEVSARIDTMRDALCMMGLIDCEFKPIDTS